jgi:hypothetical protein
MIINSSPFLKEHIYCGPHKAFDYTMTILPSFDDIALQPSDTVGRWPQSTTVDSGVGGSPTFFHLIEQPRTLPPVTLTPSAAQVAAAAAVVIEGARAARSSTILRSQKG